MCSYRSDATHCYACSAPVYYGHRRTRISPKSCLRSQSVRFLSGCHFTGALHSTVPVSKRLRQSEVEYARVSITRTVFERVIIIVSRYILIGTLAALQTDRIRNGACISYLSGKFVELYGMHIRRGENEDGRKITQSSFLRCDGIRNWRRCACWYCIYHKMRL